MKSLPLFCWIVRLMGIVALTTPAVGQVTSQESTSPLMMFPGEKPKLTQENSRDVPPEGHEQLLKSLQPLGDDSILIARSDLQNQGGIAEHPSTENTSPSQILILLAPVLQQEQRFFSIMEGIS